MKITKAVIPAAGLGTRFLPFTKAVPKEMLPLLNTPAIQHIIQEGIDSGISDFSIITSDAKPALEQYFQHNPELEKLLKDKNKSQLLDTINSIIQNTHINYITQPEPLGLGHAILMTKHAIGNNYFGVFLPDDIIISAQPALAQLAAIAQEHNASVIAAQEVPQENISAYGVIAPTQQITDTVFGMSHVVEKPAAHDAPSNLAIVGRYIFSPDIFDAIEAITPESRGEIQLTDAINYLIKTGKKVLAYKVSGNRYDTGQPLGWLQANIHLGLANPEYAPHIKNMLNSSL